MAGQVHAEQKTSDLRVVHLFSLLVERMTRCFARVGFRHCHVTLQPYLVEVDSKKNRRMMKYLIFNLEAKYNRVVRAGALLSKFPVSTTADSPDQHKSSASPVQQLQYIKC